MKHSATLSLLSLLGTALLLGCGEDAPSAPPPITLDTLKLQGIEWNGKKVNVGHVAAVGELGEDTLVLGDQGAMVFTSGLVLATDASVRAWRQADVIPAGDLSGSWVVAVDGMGRVRRLRNRSTMEDVSDRYGLKDAQATGVTSLGAGKVGFTVGMELAVADGHTVTRYPWPYTGLAGGGGRAAGIGAGGEVHVFTPDNTQGTATGQSYTLPDGSAVAVAFDVSGVLYMASANALYAEGQSGGLLLLYETASPDVPIRALATAGTGVWVAIGDTLALLGDGKLKRSAAGVIDKGARLIGSPGGDVWIITGGALTRMAEDTGGGADQDLWRRTMLPLFVRTCSLCHVPGGTSGIDLSSYKAWAARRALVGMRVLDKKPTPMPPAGAGTLSETDIQDVRAWVMSH